MLGWGNNYGCIAQTVFGVISLSLIDTPLGVGINYRKKKERKKH
jgi:hypothetical protein